MNQKKYLSLALIILAFSACNSNKTDPEFNYNNIPDSTKQSSQVTMPGTSQQNQTTTLQLPNTNSQSGNVELNPEHGKPGHRCELAVGAPLNSNPVTKSNTAQTTQPTITSTTPTTPAITTQTTGKTTSNNTNTALNPEHGKPGHRCDIGVGQPLNSKPTSITQQTTSQTQPVVAKTKTTTAPGMNPAHGEPGHRCDIAVGTSLSQPIKKDTAKHAPLILAPSKDSSKK